MINVFKLLPLSDWLWIGLAVSLWGYHEFAIHEAVVRAHEECKAQVAAANAAAKAAHDSTQAQTDKDAAAQNTANGLKIDAISRQTNLIASQLAGMKPKTYSRALPINCVFDDERIKDANNAIH